MPAIGPFATYVRGESVCHWLGDSQRWVDLYAPRGGQRVQCFVHCGGTDRSVQRFEVRPASLPRGFWPVAAGRRLLAEDYDAERAKANRCGLVTVEVDLVAARPAVRRWMVPMPERAWATDAAYSRDGRRVAFLMHARAEPTRLVAWLRRVTRLPGATPRERITVCVSGLGGHGLRRLGWVDAFVDPDTTLLMHYPDELRWTDDGRRLSFVMDEALWTVAVD